MLYSVPPGAAAGDRAGDRRQGRVDFVRDDVHLFTAGAEQADDITLLAVRWLGPRAAS